MNTIKRNTEIDNTILGILATHSICTTDTGNATGPKEIAKIYGYRPSAVKASIARLMQAEKIERVQIGTGSSFYNLTNR